MPIDNWIAFLVASIVITLIPGPSVLLVISQALTKGKAAAFMCIAGDVVGTIVLIILSYMGLGAILAASTVLFQITKWAGICYLAYLGYRQIADARNGQELATHEDNDASNWQSFWIGSVTAVLNPKAIIFYMAFLAQFISPEGNVFVQLSILTATSIMTIIVFLTIYALIAAKAKDLLSSARAQRNIGYTGGGMMIAGSAVMAATR